MSVVTNLIVSFSSLEDVEVRSKEMNSFVYNRTQINLVSIDYNKDMQSGKCWYGGNKFFEGNLFIGAYDHFNTADFIQHLKIIPWEAPDLVQVFVKEEEDEKFKILELE